MPFVAQAIVSTLGMDASPQVKAVKTGIAGVREYKTETQKAMAGAAEAMKSSAAAGENSFKMMLSNVKADFGKGSLVGQVTKLLAGGGAIMGISMAANQFKDFTAQLLQMKEAINSSTGDWESLTEKVASSIPIFGSFFEAGLNIREMLTGEKAAMKAAEEESKKYDDALLFHKQIIGEIREANLRHADTIRDLAQAYSLIGKSGITRELQEIQNHTDNLVKSSWAKSGFAALNPEELKKLTEAQKQLRELPPPPTMETRDQIFKREQRDQMFPDERDSHIDEVVAAQQAELVKYNTAKTLIQNSVKDLVAKMANADKNAVSETMTARFVGLAEKADVFKNKWVGAFDEFAQAGKRRIDEMNRIVNDRMADMRLALAQLGMTDSQKKVDDFRRLNGSSDSMVAEYKKGQAKIDAFNKNKEQNTEFDDKVKGMVESLKTPMQKFNDAKFQWMKALGMGKIDAGQFNLGVANAYREAMPDRDYKRPELIMAGSAEAQAAKFDGQDKKMDLVDVAKESLEVQKIMRDLQKDLVDKFPDMSAAQVWELTTS